MAVRNFTVECAEHGPMLRDELRRDWTCEAGGCPAWMTDERVRRLVTDAPADSPDPVPVVVT